MFDHVCPEMLTVSLRLNCQYHELFMALQTIIQVKGLDFFNMPTTNNNSNVNSTTKLIQFVSKILGVINKINDKAPQEMASNFNSYMVYLDLFSVKLMFVEFYKRLDSLLETNKILNQSLMSQMWLNVYKRLLEIELFKYKWQPRGHYVHGMVNWFLLKKIRDLDQHQRWDQEITSWQK